MEKEKEVYRLWWECLKRNPDYKEFCEWVRKRRINKELPIPDKFRKENHGGHTPAEAMCFFTFYDVHANSFDEWWELHEQRKMLNNPHPVVSDYAELIEREFDNCIESFKASHEGREPSLQEFKEDFCQSLKRTAWFSFFKVSITEDKSVIKKELDKMINSCKEKPHVKALIETRRNSYLKQDGKHVRIDELKTYLEVYDLKTQGLKPKDIIKKHNPNLDYKYESMQRLYRRYFEKAKKIIANVKHGLFPGKY